MPAGQHRSLRGGAARPVIPRRLLPLLAAGVLTACAANGPAGRSTHTERGVIECAPFARAQTGLQLFGDAASWWDSAAGHYRRANAPEPGAVLVFRRSPRLPHGHVSVVAALRTPREIAVTQANWVHDRIARNEPVVDVSPGNDWTAVRVWWDPSGALGTTVYPTYGFVLPGSARSDLLAEAAALCDPASG